MPIIEGPNATQSTGEFPEWGLARFPAGMRNVTALHYHDCDEFVFMVEGRCVMRSEGVLYTLEKGDVLVTRMGDFLAAVENGTEPTVSGRANLATMRAILAELESARRGGVWMTLSG